MRHTASAIALFYIQCVSCATLENTTEEQVITEAAVVVAVGNPCTEFSQQLTEVPQEYSPVQTQVNIEVEQFNADARCCGEFSCFAFRHVAGELFVRLITLRRMTRLSR